MSNENPKPKMHKFLVTVVRSESVELSFRVEGAHHGIAKDMAITLAKNTTYPRAKSADYRVDTMIEVEEGG